MAAKALLVLEDHPLSLNEPGPTITVTRADVNTYVAERNQNESVLPVVAAVPVGAGADAAVVAGRLAQPAMSAVPSTNDITMSFEPRVTMTPPFRTTSWVSQRRANPITATAVTTKDCSLRCCLVSRQSAPIRRRASSRSERRQNDSTGT